MIERLTIRRLDNGHMHLRDGAMLAAIAGLSLRGLDRALSMPNLLPLTKGAPWQPPWPQLAAVETGPVETGVVEMGAVERGEGPVTVFDPRFSSNWHVEEAA
ncbi:MAG: hypothetical protein AAF565_19365 [Pseudomonadota bacterium]